MGSKSLVPLLLVDSRSELFMNVSNSGDPVECEVNKDA
jgi:hypothetical protein